MIFNDALPLLVVLGIGVFVYWCFKNWRGEQPTTREYTYTKGSLCTSCGWCGTAKVITRGNFATELILWLVFIVPGLLYSLWRLTTRYKGCPQCGANPIPIDSPVAIQFMAKLNKHSAPKKSAPAPQYQEDVPDRPKVYVIK